MGNLTKEQLKAKLKGFGNAASGLTTPAATVFTELWEEGTQKPILMSHRETLF